jgi:predicted RecB family endonuclease
MSYPKLYDQLPTRRFATVFGGRAAAANYHGVRIARLLALKMGLRPIDVLPFMARPLAREAARALGVSANHVLADLVVESEENGGCNGR